MANTIGEKELKRNWPVVTGLGATDKHEGRKPYLKADKSYVLSRDKAGI